MEVCAVISILYLTAEYSTRCIVSNHQSCGIHYSYVNDFPSRIPYSLGLDRILDPSHGHKTKAATSTLSNLDASMVHKRKELSEIITSVQVIQLIRPRNLHPQMSFQPVNMGRGGYDITGITPPQPPPKPQPQPPPQTPP